MLFEALTLCALSMCLGALLHKIYIESHGMTFSIPGWEFKVKNDADFFANKFILTGKKFNGYELTFVADIDSFDLDYGKSK